MISNALLISNFIVDGLKRISYLLDHAVYSLATVVYQAFYYLANATLLDAPLISQITERVYAIVGVIMIFVLAFNLLTYIIDPDKLTDKKTGATAIIKDIVIALVLLTMLPTIFTKLYSLQSKILTSNVISNIILGGYADENLNTFEDYQQNKDDYKSMTQYYVDNGANLMVANVYAAFLSPITDTGDEFSALDCITKIDEYPEYNEYCDAYKKAKKTGSISSFSDFITKDNYNYFPLLSTVGGIVLLFFMLSFCLNLGKRVGKMAILQLMAPIPIVMEILPNKKGRRKTWLDMLIKAYLEVFMFLAVVYVVVFLISLIPSAVVNLFSNATDAGATVKIIVTVMLIFGLLQFGKEAPQMIFDILGIKSTGIISAAAKRALAMGGVTGGLLGSSLGRFSRNFNAETNRTLGQKFASGFAGVGSGFARTLWGARNVHNLKDAKALRTNVNKNLTTARVNRSAYTHAHGGTFVGAMQGHAVDFGKNVSSNIRGYMGMQNDYERKKRIDQINSEYKKLYSSEIESIWKNDSQWKNASAEVSKYEYMIKSGAVSDTTVDHVTGLTYGQLLSQAKTQRDYAKSESIRKNGAKLMEGAGKLNNFIDTHQGISGITLERLDLNNAINNNGEGRIEFIVGRKDNNGNIVENGIEQIVVKGRSTNEGYDPQLSALKQDIPYQKQKVEEKIQQDARDARKKAATEANNQNKKN